MNNVSELVKVITTMVIIIIVVILFPKHSYSGKALGRSTACGLGTPV